jgi:hypothetical protein
VGCSIFGKIVLWLYYKKRSYPKQSAGRIVWKRGDLSGGERRKTSAPLSKYYIKSLQKPIKSSHIVLKKILK